MSADRARAALVLLGAAVALTMLLRFACAGSLPSWIEATAIPLAFIACAAAAVRVVVIGDRVVHRFGFWMVVTASLLTLPHLGNVGLFDPWESEYADVAREMITRHDFITAVWGHEGWFMSKPALAPWLQAIAMLVCGVDPQPGHVLGALSASTAPARLLAEPEWALRFPNFVLAVFGTYVLYRGAACSLGRRGAFLGTLVLWTSAQWLLFAHQAIFDMATVAPLCASMGLVMAALATDEHRACSPELKLALGLAIAFIVVPQVLYLCSRHITLHAEAHRFSVALHRDHYFAGSPGNCTLPGQIPCSEARVAWPRLQPWLQALGWTSVLGLVLDCVAAERTARRALFLAAWIAAGVATMGKGLVGFVMPMGTLVAWIVVTGRLRVLRDARLLTGLLVIALLVCPWYVANCVRHGRVFFDELVMRHMIGRTLGHLHDTNEGEDTTLRYYVWQLGYALFPWSGLVPVAACATLAQRSEGRRAGATFLFLWFALAFALVSSMQTKFHHYILPAVPPLAMLAGSLLDDARRAPRRWLAAAAVASAAVLALVTIDLTAHAESGARFVYLFTYLYRRPWPAHLDFHRVLGGLAVAMAFGSFFLASRRSSFVLATGLTFAVWLGNVYLPRSAEHWSQRSLVARFAEQRASPEEPLVAYQMNWKGESFYTGNRLAIFVSSGAPFARYIEELRKTKGRRVFFVTEHERVARLQSELGPSATLTPLSTKRENNKFCLLSAEL